MTSGIKTRLTSTCVLGALYQNMGSDDNVKNLNTRNCDTQNFIDWICVLWTVGVKDLENQERKEERSLKS